MKFLVDAQLPPALARVLESEGYEARHVKDLGMAAHEDPEIWDYALEQGMIVITKDEDFAHRYSQGGLCPVIIWLRIGNTSRRALLVWFKPLLGQIIEMIEQGERFMEVR